MKHETEKIFDDLFLRYPALCAVKEDIRAAFVLAADTFKCGGKLLVCGNGGSASDAEHIAGELLKSFRKPRKISGGFKNKLAAYPEGGYIAVHLEGALPVISLTSHVAFNTAFANDVRPELAYAQQLYALGKSGDLLLAISTSGNSSNCVYAAVAAAAADIKTVALTGKDGGRLKQICGVSVCVPETETYKVQELHLPVYHALCAMLEEELF